MKSREKSICLRPGCGKPAVARGVCRKCYNVALQLVNQKRTTWEKLEKAKKILPKRRGQIVAWLLDG